MVRIHDLKGELSQEQTSRVELFEEYLALRVELAELKRAEEPIREETVEEQFRRGLRAYEEGRDDEAAQCFEDVLERPITPEEALELRDEAGYPFWVRVLAKGPDEASNLARRILRVAEQAR